MTNLALFPDFSQWHPLPVHLAVEVVVALVPPPILRVPQPPSAHSLHLPDPTLALNPSLRIILPASVRPTASTTMTTTRR